MKNIETFESFQEPGQKKEFVLKSSKELRGFAYWQTPEETLESFKSDLYFLGYEEYEGIFAEAKASGRDIIISLDSGFSRIANREKDLGKFFRNALARILDDDYVKLYSVDGEKIGIRDIE